MTDGTLIDLLTTGADSATALVEPSGRTMTHGQLRAGIHELAGQLSNFGVGSGDRVALVMGNGSLYNGAGRCGWKPYIGPPFTPRGT